MTPEYVVCWDGAHGGADRDGSSQDATRSLSAIFGAQLDEWDLWRSDPSEAFERIARQFYNETGLLAPGKSVPLEMSSVDHETERRQRYEEWSQARNVVRQKMLRDVSAHLAALVQVLDKLKALELRGWDEAEGLTDWPAGFCHGESDFQQRMLAVLASAEPTTP